MSKCIRIEGYCPPVLKLKRQSWCVLKRIGSGGDADVYKAINKKDDQHVAVKVFTGSESQQRLNFKKEVKIARGISSKAFGCTPGFTCMLDFGSFDCGDDSRYAIVYSKANYDLQEWMEKVRKRPIDQRQQIPSPIRKKLAGYVTNLNKLPTSQQIKYNFVVSMIRSLQWLRKNKMVHRDIKPSNILVYGTFLHPEFSLGDLGDMCNLSNTKRRFTKVPRCNPSHVVKGTLDYIPWGTLRKTDSPYKSKTNMMWQDIFAMGCSIYTFFTGMEVANIDIKSANPRAYAEKHFPFKLDKDIEYEDKGTVYGMRADVLTKMVNKMLFSKSYDKASTYAKYVRKLTYKKVKD